MCTEFRQFQRFSCSYQGDKPISEPLTSTQLLIGPHKGESWPLDFVSLMFATEKEEKKWGNWLRSDCKSYSCSGIKDVVILDLDVPHWVTMQLFTFPQFFRSLSLFFWSSLWLPLQDKLATLRDGTVESVCTISACSENAKVQIYAHSYKAEVEQCLFNLNFTTSTGHLAFAVWRPFLSLSPQCEALCGPPPTSRPSRHLRVTALEPDTGSTPE